MNNFFALTVPAGLRLFFMTMLLPTSLLAQESDVTDSLTIKHSGHLHPFPLSCAGIIVGKTSDKEVQSLYGPGVLNPNEGHGGARYYIDAQKKVSLRVTIGVDNIVEEVSITSTGYPFDYSSSKEFDKAKSYVSINPSSADSIHIGDDPSKILKKYGKPNSDEAEDVMQTLTYEDSNEQWKDVFFYRAIFEFRHNNLVRITLRNA